MNIEEGLEKLNSILPLKVRQQSLEPEGRKIHREILNSFATNGKTAEDIDPGILKILENNDQVVLDESKTKVIGAYPFSLKKTSHRIYNDQIDLYAMCAFDAIAIAPVFNVNINVESHCYVTNEPIEITQHADKVISVKPSKDIYIGIRWQSAGSCAAESLCMEMLYLKDEATAKQWQGRNEAYSIYPLPAAIEFATRYFKPLISD